MVCQEPGDLTLFILKLLTKSSDGEVGFIFYVARVVVALTMDCVEGVILVSDVLEASEGILWATVIGPSIIAICFLTVLGGLAIRVGLSASQKRKRKSRFFVIFKTINVIFAIALTGGVVYGWDELDIINDQEASKMFLVVSLGIDILMDPIELIISLCIFCC